VAAAEAQQQIAVELSKAAPRMDPFIALLGR
jgi:hypothetical protein